MFFVFMRSFKRRLLRAVTANEIAIPKPSFRFIRAKEDRNSRPVVALHGPLGGNL